MTAEFQAVEGQLLDLRFALDEGQSWTFGRDPDESTFVLEDRKVSRKHLLCRKTDEGYVVENLSRTNPAKLNSEPLVEPTLLKEGDLLTIGSTIFRFHDKASTEDAVFEDAEFSETPEVHFDLHEDSRFVLKVISGPNTGAEIALEPEKEYIIGTDVAVCDIVFHDLSISRQHGRLRLSKEGLLTIEDLGSRNGIFVKGEKITGESSLPPNTLVTLGTSSFLVIDKEAPSATIAAPFFEGPHEEIMPEEEEFVEEKALPPTPEKVPEAPKAPKKPLAPGSLIISLILIGLVVLLGIGIVSLFQSKELGPVPESQMASLNSVLNQYPGVKYTFNESTGRLFLIGHVSTGIEKGELLYNLRTLCFIRGVDDHIVDDEAIWQEMNLLLANNPNFNGVSMHSPMAGKFVVSGYLGTIKEASALTDYLNLHFTYLDLLENCVCVIEEVSEEVSGRLIQKGFTGVKPDFSNGTLVLMGYIPTEKEEILNDLVKQFEQIPCVKKVNNFVVMVHDGGGIGNLNETGKYSVTGFSKHGDVNINIVINGRILMRGDSIDGYTVTSIQNNAVFFEKDGVKYRLDYNEGGFHDTCL